MLTIAVVLIFIPVEEETDRAITFVTLSVLK